MWCIAILLKRGAMRMLLTYIYLLFIYILFIYVIAIAAVAVALFVALMVTIRKLDKIKNTSLSGHRDVFLIKNYFMIRHTLVVSLLLYLLYSNIYQKSNILINFFMLLFSNKTNIVVQYLQDFQTSRVQVSQVLFYSLLFHLHF